MSQRPRPVQTRRRRLAVASALGLLVVGAGAVALGQDSAPASPARSAALPAAAEEPGLVHVHGLGVDPADGRLYAATHSGLFEVPEQGEAQRIANRYQDTMGFTVAGPGEFLGSGHPDSREDPVRPPLLGLISSTDQGRTWDRLSLHGQADFHALRAAHDRVYGYDATTGTFMVTADRKQWERRSQLPVRDFVVSPTDPELVLATTPQGLARSADGGRTWSAVPGAPALVVLAWGGAGDLFGVGERGRVHHSTDGGATWQARSTTGGEPEAAIVDTSQGASVLYLAVRSGGILASRDAGRTFTARYTPS